MIFIVFKVYIVLEWIFDVLGDCLVIGVGIVLDIEMVWMVIFVGV